MIDFLFQPTPSSRRETKQVQRNSITQLFQPTPSSRRETWTANLPYKRVQNFNPLPPRGGRPYTYRDSHIPYKISTHSLLAEGDIDSGAGGKVNELISTHSLLAEGDQTEPRKNRNQLISTHSLLAEGDQATSIRPARGLSHFNPLPPRGGRPFLLRFY